VFFQLHAYFEYFNAGAELHDQQLLKYYAFILLYCWKGDWIYPLSLPQTSKYKKEYFQALGEISLILYQCQISFYNEPRSVLQLLYLNSPFSKDFFSI
jgi:hypothetical protein